MKDIIYLPGSTAQRIKQIQEAHKLSQTEMAKIADISVSAMSKLQSDKIDRISARAITNIAEHFNTTVDFVLGRVDVPDKSIYNIQELKLSKEAAVNLYTGRANPAVINALLENPKFADLTNDLYYYFLNSVEGGVASHNELLACVSETLKVNGISEAENEIESNKIKQTDAMQRSSYAYEFDDVIKNIKDSIDVNRDSTQLTKETFGKMLDEVTQGSQKPVTKVKPEQIIGAIKLNLSKHLDYMTFEEIEDIAKSLSPAFAPIPIKEQADD